MPQSTSRNCHNGIVNFTASTESGGGMPLRELRGPDLDLIKQGEQGMCDRVSGSARRGAIVAAGMSSLRHTALLNQKAGLL